MLKTKISFSILFLFLLSCSKKYPTDFSVQPSQISFYESAEKSLKKKDLYNALNSFNYAYSFDKSTALGQRASKKFDSLLPIFKSSNYKKIKGLWELKEIHKNPYMELFPYYIEFKDEEINFYNYDSLGTKNLVRKEEKTYTEIDSNWLTIEANHFTFKNSEQWSFYAKKKKGKLKLYPKIQRDSKGGSSTLLDERGIISNKRDRRKALKKELYTYYVLIK